MPELEHITIGQLLRRTAQRFPERTALEYDGDRWSYARMDGAVDLFARVLLGRGVKKGDHVGIWCEAEPNALLMFYAVTRIGAAAVMYNTSLGRQELADLLRATDTAWLLIGDGYKDICYPRAAQGLKEELPALRDIVYIGTQGNCSGHTPLERIAGEAASAEALAAAEAAVRPEDTATILFTSGTTSRPKAVRSSHFSRANSGILQAADLAADENDRFCVAMPIFHCFCLSVNVLAACAVGACVHLPKGRRTGALLEAVQQGRCTVFSCVPALFHALLCREDLKEWDISSLRTGFIGGSMYPPELFIETEKTLGFTLLSSLGQTEATAGITVCRFDDPLSLRATAVGRFMQHVEGKIAHPKTGAPQPAGEAGEICVRGYVVMQDYYKDPAATAKAIDGEGWLHTGDAGWQDTDGNIHLTGRLKELIIRGGENISPAEIENALAEDPRVAACKAVGVPDAHYGEEVCLCVVPAEGAAQDGEALREALAQKLADFKVPRYVLFLDALPTTFSGKVQLKELKAAAAERLGLQ